MKHNICFVHIEKAGGTTFNDLLLSTFADYWIMPPQKRPLGWRYDGAYLNNLRRLLPFNHVGGHQLGAYCGYEQVFQNPLYVSFVREPISRTISHVNWITETKRQTDRSFSELCESLSNTQCFRISGERTFEAAKNVIASRNYFVGLADEYDRSVYAFQKQCEMAPRPFASSNLTPNKKKRIRSDEMSPDMLQHIRTANEQDSQLYEWIKSTYFPKQIASVDWQETEFESLRQGGTDDERASWSPFALRKKFRNQVTKLATQLIRR